MAYIAKLNLQNFRNYQDLNINFYQGINFLYGDNGQGKTNILEAIYFASLLKSFRTNQNKDLFHFGTNSFFLGAIINDVNNKIVLKVNYGEKKVFFRNGYQVNQGIDFVNSFQTISFLLEDINLIKGISSLRRTFLNMDISKLYANYLVALKNHHKLLKIRHSLFRKFSNFSAIDKLYLNSFDKKLVYNSKIILQYRQKWFDIFKIKLAIVSYKLFGNESELQIFYKKSINIALDDDFYDSYNAILQKNLLRDYSSKTTYYGCHRDDFDLIFRTKKLSVYGSQGQCRLASLALKLTATEVFFEVKKNQKLIFLVDDVLGELDEKVKQVFFEVLDKTQQVFITATNKQALNGHDAKYFNIKQGNIINS